MSKKFNLEVDPATLVYYAPFDRRQSSSVKLSNTGQKRVAIKLRTSDNSLFLANVTVGLIEPGQVKMLHVRCLPFTFDANKQYDHKLVVLYIAAPDDQSDAAEIWKTVTAWRELTIKVEFKNEPEPAPPTPNLLRICPVCFLYTPELSGHSIPIISGLKCKYDIYNKIFTLKTADDGSGMIRKLRSI
ncbi:Motile Sperm domain containing protein [Trichuris trichiura]|uniref:Major sperm protein n=1 Tax=Trichuris trichiura TaxID=36087 RepID=A0A077Z7M4_TRITR|nr:Motile Sperm domain containing protein [Trichuris trichiura]